MSNRYDSVQSVNLHHHFEQQSSVVLNIFYIINFSSINLKQVNSKSSFSDNIHLQHAFLVYVSILFFTKLLS